MERIIIEPEDFGKLHLVNGNRMISVTHVSQLVGEFKKFGDGDPSKMFNKDFPVLLNKDENGDYLIIDGQHRVEVCKKLNIPIVAMVSDKQYSLSEIVNINTSQKGWTTKDIIDSYSRDLNFPYRYIYQEVMRIINNYSEIPYTVILAVVANYNAYGGSNTSVFKTGKFQGPIDSSVCEKLEFARNCYSGLVLKKIDKKQTFYQAMIKACGIKNFDKGRFLSKIADFKPQPSYILNCLEVERVYNNGLRAEKRIELVGKDDIQQFLKR